MASDRDQVLGLRCDIQRYAMVGKFQSLLHCFRFYKPSSCEHLRDCACLPHMPEMGFRTDVNKGHARGLRLKSRAIERCTMHPRSPRPTRCPYASANHTASHPRLYLPILLISNQYPIHGKQPRPEKNQNCGKPSPNSGSVPFAPGYNAPLSAVTQ